MSTPALRFMRLIRIGLLLSMGLAVGSFAVPSWADESDKDNPKTDVPAANDSNKNSSEPTKLEENGAAPKKSEAIDPEKADSKPSKLDTKKSNKKNAAAKKLGRKPQSLFDLHLPDGTPIHWIGVYQTQLVEILPTTYRPISVEQLHRWIKSQPGTNLDQACLPTTSVFIADLVDGQLVGRDSYIEFRRWSDGPLHFNLGSVNLSLSPSPTSESSNELRFANGIDGSLYLSGEPTEPFDEASPDGHSTVRIPLDWTLAGSANESGHEFQLKLPPTLQTTFYISVPSKDSLVSETGIVREVDGPPLPDTQQTETKSLLDPVIESSESVAISNPEDRRWYQVDSGGQTSLMLKVNTNDARAGEAEVVIRQASIRYQIDSVGLFWSQWIEMERPSGGELPAFSVENSSATSVRLNGNEIPFELDPQNPDQLILRPALPLSDDQDLRLNIVGFSAWKPQMALPLVRPINQSFLSTASIDDAQISVQDGLALSDWTLPVGWNKTMIQLASGGIVHSATGPSLMQSQLTTVPQTDKPSWSAIKLIPQDDRIQTDASMRINANEERVSVSKRFTFYASQAVTEPIHFEIEKQFAVNSVEVLKTSAAEPLENRVTSESIFRILDDAKNSQFNELVVWPSADDWELRAEVSVAGDDASGDQPDKMSEIYRNFQFRLVVELGGERLRSTPVRENWPPIWFAQRKDFPTSVDVAIHPPSGRKWEVDSIGAYESPDTSKWTSAKQKFLRNDRSNVLLMRAIDGIVPSLQSSNPGVAFDVDTRFKIQHVNDRLQRKFAVAVQSAGRSLEQIRLTAGDWRNWRWSLISRTGLPLPELDSAIDAEPDVILSPSQIQPIKTGNDPSSHFEVLIDVTPLDLREFILVGDVALDQEQWDPASNPSITVSLPSVMSASNQNCEGVVDSSLVSTGGSASVVFETLSPAVIATDDTQSFRYDPSVVSEIVVRPPSKSARISVVDQITYSIVASSDSSDQLTIEFDGTLSSGLNLLVPLDFRLVSATRKNEDLRTEIDPTGAVVLPADLVRRNYLLTYTRTGRRSGQWLRTCRIPNITCDAIVLRSQWFIKASDGDFLPRSVMQITDSDQQIIANPDDKVWILPLPVVIAFGWVIAAILYAWGLVLSRKKFGAVVFAICVAGAITVLCWRWHTAAISFLLLPLILAAATESLFRFGNREPQTVRENDSVPIDASQEISWTNHSNRQVLGWLIAIGLWIAPNSLEAQNALEEKQTASDSVVPSSVQPIEAIVPMSMSGQPSGSIVYVPEALAAKVKPVASNSADLAQSPDADSASTIRFQSARYIVRLSRVPAALASQTGTSPRLVDDAGNETQEPESEEVVQADVDAEYRLDLASNVQSPSNDLWMTLPIGGTNVRQIESIGPVGRRIRFDLDQTTGRLRVGRSDLASDRIRVRYRISLSATDDQLHLVLPIVPVSASELVITSDMPLQSVRALTAAGAITTGLQIAADDQETGLAGDARRFNCPLGPIAALDVQIRLQSSFDDQNIGPLRRRYFVNFNSLGTVIDCEIEPSHRIVAGEYFQFVIRDADFPKSVSNDWTWVDSELYSSTRRLVTVQARRENPGPIRLIWQREHGDEPVTIPEVIAAALGENAPALIAYHAAPSIRATSLGRDPLESLSVDQFRLSWRGYQEDTIDRVLVASNQLPQWRVEPVPNPVSIVRSQQTFYVDSTRQTLSVNATIDCGSQIGEAIGVELPKEWVVTQAELNGQVVVPAMEQDESTTRYVLGYTDSSTQIDLRISAVPRFGPWTSNPEGKPANTSKRYRISRFPCVIVTPGTKSTVDYSIRRGIDVNASLVKAPLLQPLDDYPAVTDDDLAQGQVPVARWLQQSSKISQFDCWLNQWGTWMISPQPSGTPLDCTLKVQVKEGQWSSSYTLAPQSGSDSIVVDNDSILDVDIPATWEKSLAVTPDIRFLVRSSVDPDRRQLRLWSDSIIKSPITLTADIDRNDLSRLEIPRVRVARRPISRTRIELPTVYDERPIQWNMIGVQPIKRGDTLVLEANNPRWSIVRRRSEPIEKPMIIHSLESMLIETTHGRLVRCRLELSPDNSRSLPIRLPKGATWIGGSVAGRAVTPLESTSVTDTNENAEDQLLQIPLALSKLPHSIELLYRVADSTARTEVTIDKIPIIHTWYGTLAASDVRVIPTSVLDDRIQRTLTLGNSLIEAFENAVDELDNRQSDEVLSWLRSHRLRLSKLQIQFGQEVSLTGVEKRISFAKRWELLDKRLNELYQRYSFVPEPLESTWAEAAEEVPISQFNGLVEVQLSTSPYKSVPVTRAGFGDDSSLRWILVNALTLMLVIGCLLRLRKLWPRIHRLGQHPAFWLAFLGFASMAIFPLPISLALIVVASLFGIWPNRRPTL